MCGSRWSCRLRRVSSFPFCDASPGLDGELTQGTKQRAVEIEGVRGTGRKTRASRSDVCSWSDGGSWSEALRWRGHKTPRQVT